MTCLRTGARRVAFGAGAVAILMVPGAFLGVVPIMLAGTIAVAALLAHIHLLLLADSMPGHEWRYVVATVITLFAVALELWLVAAVAMFSTSVLWWLWSR
jgi:hypothetical protein